MNRILWGMAVQVFLFCFKMTLNRNLNSERCLQLLWKPALMFNEMSGRYVDSLNGMLLSDWWYSRLFNKCALMDVVYWQRARTESTFVNTCLIVRLLYDLFKILQVVLVMVAWLLAQIVSNGEVSVALLASFPLGVPSSYASGSTSALWLIVLSPVLDIPTFSTSTALPRPLSRESWSCKPVI
jgi:hypothetical protein